MDAQAGSRGYIGHKADIWSSAVILYTILAGYRPFRATATNNNTGNGDEEDEDEDDEAADAELFAKIRAGKVGLDQQTNKQTNKQTNLRLVYRLGSFLDIL